MKWLSRNRSKSGSPQIDRRELEALFEFSRSLVGAAGIGEIANVLFRTIDDLCEIDQCLLLSISDDQSRATCVATMGANDSQAGTFEIDLADDHSAVSMVVRDRAAHRVLDAQRESLHNLRLADVLGVRSALYVPLMTSGGVIAIAVVGTTEQTRAFRREEVDLIQKIANDAAVAIERARFAQALREVGENELVVASIARSIRDSLDPDQVLLTAARELGEQTDADKVFVRMLWSEELEGRSCEWNMDEITVRPLGDDELVGSASLAVEDRQTVVARAGKDASAGTQLSVPLMHRENVVGVLTIDRSGTSFGMNETKLIELIAVELSAAIEYVRLYQGGRRHLDEQLALARAAQSLTADLRFERVIEHLVDEVVKILRTDSAAFYVYDRDEQTLTLAAAFGDEERRVVGQKMGLVGLAGRIIKTGVSQYTNNYREDLGEQIHPVFQTVERAVAVPIRWQGDLRGVVSVATHDKGRMFSAHDVAVLEAFADLASLALHNADAYSAHGRQARIQAGFYRISQVLAASLSRPQTLASLAQAATEALDGDWSLVIGGDDDEEDLHLEGSFSAPPEVLDQLKKASEFVGSPAQLGIAHRRVVTSRDIAEDERLSDHWRTLLSDASVRSVLAVPVSAHGHHTAVVVICFCRPVRFGDEELVVANNLASAASAALERAGLFDTERRTRRLAQVLADVSALLADTLKAQTVLERIVEQAAVLLDVDACSLAVVDTHGESGDLILDSVAGSDEELVEILKTAQVGGLVEEVGRSKRSVHIEDLASETSSQSLGSVQYSSYLGVPLLHPRGHLMGVLSAYSRRHRSWDAAEVQALESFSNSAALAVRNAELYAGVKRERDTIETLLASIAEGIITTDASGRVSLWNHAAEQITGIPPDQAIGRSWRDALGLTADTVIEEGQSVVEAHPAGIPIWLSVTASRVREGASDGWAIYAFRDVSANYTLDRLKSDFVSTVSYVLRTPLTSIYGFAQTLLRDDIEFDDADREVFLQYIATETERLTNIVDDLLQVTQLEAGSVEVHVTDCDVATVVDAVTVAMQARSEHHNIHSNLDDLEKVHIRADAGKLETVLTNLVDNAIQFSPQGGTVEIEAHRDNGAVRIDVSDDGVGIPQSEHKHLFTKFYVSPQANELAGSGLGLYISKGLITAMGGRIWVSSRQGSGSTFTVELPVAQRQGQN